MEISSDPPAPAVPDLKYVTLISNDGFAFVVSREAAFVSGTLRRMLSTNTFEEGQTGRAHLDEVNGAVLEKVCDYLHFNLRYKDVTDVPEFEIPPEMALELLVAADYLDDGTDAIDLNK